MDIPLRLDEIESLFLRRVQTYTGNLKQTDLVKILAQINFFQELQNLGLSDVIDQLQTDYSEILSKLITDARKVGLNLTPISVQDLETLSQLDAESILRSAEAYSSEFKSALLKGIISGEGTDTILNRLSGIGLKKNQLIAAIDTARDEFLASSTAKIYEDKPEQRFILAGPNDIKTRCACKGVLEFQPKKGHTIEEIRNGAWSKYAKKGCDLFAMSPSEKKYFDETLGGNYTFTFRGKFNCRHFPEPV